MKKVTDSYLERHMKQAVSQLVPDRAEQLWKQPAERASGREWYLDGCFDRRSTGRSVRLLSAVAACFAVCLLSYYMVHLSTDATIYLDVNPGIELQINRKEKIIFAGADNRDGEIILEDMHLKNTDLDVAVNAILGSMVKHGYLSETRNSVLLSVESRDGKRAEELRAKLVTETGSCMEALLDSGLILDQDITVDRELEDLAEQYSITPGRASLLQKLTKAHPELSYSELAKLSINELLILLKEEKIELQDYVHYTETASSDPLNDDLSEAENEEEAEEEDEDPETGLMSKDEEDAASEDTETESEEVEEDGKNLAETEALETEEEEQPAEKGSSDLHSQGKKPSGMSVQDRKPAAQIQPNRAETEEREEASPENEIQEEPEKEEDSADQDSRESWTVPEPEEPEASAPAAGIAKPAEPENDHDEPEEAEEEDDD